MTSKRNFQFFLLIQRIKQAESEKEIYRLKNVWKLKKKTEDLKNLYENIS